MTTPGRSLAEALLRTGDDAPDLELANSSWDDSTLPLSLEVIASLTDRGDPTLRVRLDLPQLPDPEASRETAEAPKTESGAKR